MSSTRIGILIAAVVLTLVALYVLLADGGPEREPNVRAQKTNRAAVGAGQSSRGDDGDRKAAGKIAPSARPEARRQALSAADQELLHRRAEIDRKRSMVRNEIDSAAANPSARVLDKQYIQEAIVDGLVPVVRECYESELEDDPELGGKVVLQFEILASEEHGGMVDLVSIDGEQSTLQNQAVHDCMRESMYAVEFPAPDQGGKVAVTYPFVFAPD
jgi:hypothetical protein